MNLNMDPHDSSFLTQSIPWSPHTVLAHRLWFGLDAANRFTLLKRWGTAKTAELEFAFLRRHQETYFLDGLRKLGLDEMPHHVASARYHVLSNILGGLDVAYLEEDDRAWAFYLPPSAFGDTGLSPSAGILAVPSEVLLAGFRAWHANNGAMLGNERLRFTLVSLMTEGGPFDAGYWDFAPKPLSESERFRVQFSNDPPTPGPPPEFAGASWPQARKDLALRKYSAQYAMGGVAQIAEFAGMDEALEVLRASMTALFVSWGRILVRELPVEATGPAERVASLMKFAYELIGDTLELTTSGSSAVLRHHSTRMSVPEYSGWESPPTPVLEVMAEVWATVARTIGPAVDVRVAPSPGTVAEWTITPSGRGRP